MRVINNRDDIPVSDALVSRLQEVFPDQLPRQKKDYGGFSIDHLIGQQTVIDYILSLHDNNQT